jgi:MYXO-CTERM domain-containing protein
MKNQRTLMSRILLFGILYAALPSPLLAGFQASATYTFTQVSPTTWEYDFTLTDAGTTPLGTFWFSWLPGQGYMQTHPISAIAPTGWVAVTTNGTAAGDGFSERWVDTAGALNPGDSLSGFSFISATTPDQLAGASPFHGGIPELTSDAYMGAPLVGPDAPFLVTLGTKTTATPEPSSFALALSGIAALLFVRRRRTTAASGAAGGTSTVAARKCAACCTWRP